MDDFEFDTEFFISLVETKPVLWDKTGDTYKDRNEAKTAYSNQPLYSLHWSLLTRHVLIFHQVYLQCQ
jgi:hypothetical protein